MTPSSARVLPWAAFLACCLVWGSTWSAIKIGYEGVPAFTGAALRFLIASGLLFGILAVFRLPFPRGRAEWGVSLFMGTLLFGTNYGLIYWGEQFIPSGVTSVLFATLPLWTLLVATGARMERLTARRLMGITLGIAGVATLFSDQLRVAGTPAPAVIAIVTGAVCAAFAGVAVKRFAQDMHPVTLNAPAMLAGGLVLTGVAFATGERVGLPVTGAAWGSVLYLAVVGSIVTFLLYTWLLKRWDASQASFVSVVTPLVALLLGALLLGEALTWRIAAGTALVLAGVITTLVRAGRATGAGAERDAPERI